MFFKKSYRGVRLSIGFSFMGRFVLLYMYKSEVEILNPDKKNTNGFKNEQTTCLENIFEMNSINRDNCIQNCHLGRFIVGYTVGNLVLRRRVSCAVNVYQTIYLPKINENFEYGYTHSYALVSFVS